MVTHWKDPPNEGLFADGRADWALYSPLLFPPRWREVMEYEAATFGDFLRRIAIDYMRYGYVRWALRHIPPDRDPSLVDGKLVEVYGVTSCRTSRMRQRRRGLAVVQYVRHCDTFVLLATEGAHEQFDRLRSYDARVTPLHLRSYSIGVQGDRVVVQVRHEVWQAVSERLQFSALGKRATVEERIAALPFYRFPGVNRQIRALVGAINRRRRVAGLPLVVTDTDSRWHHHTSAKVRP